MTMIRRVLSILSRSAASDRTTSVENGGPGSMRRVHAGDLGEASRRISVLRFPLIVAVVFIHAYVLGATPAATGQSDTISWVAHYVRNLVSQGITRTAVPIFFLISGYLFYRNFSLSLSTYVAKIRSRTETLLIPFLFWNLLIFLLFAIAQSNPRTSGFFSGTVIRIPQLTWSESLAVLLGIGRDPIAYQFWFIRNLMVAVVLSPILFLLLTRVPKTAVLLAFIIWLGFNEYPSAEGLFFFVVGSAAAIRSIDIFALDPYGKYVACSYVVLALIDAAVWDSGAPYLHMLAIAFGVLTVLYLSKFVAEREALARPLTHLAGASFFVFAAHEPLLTICRKIIDKVAPATDAMMGLLYYATIPALIIVLLVAVRGAIARSLPSFARIIGAGAQAM